MADRRLGEYVVRRLVGRGGMAEVWEGLDPDLDRRVAIKVILPHLSKDPAFGDRLRGEARLVAALRHPNIVHLYDFDLVDGQAIMVMEYLAGGSLRDQLARLHGTAARLPLATAVHLLEAIASGLDYAHARGAVHRDLKPGNILFAEDGTPVISDFGIAKIVQGASPLQSPTAAEPGSILGTPAYMSPEQAGGGTIDPRSDLYSLGIVLYEIVTGRLPFMGDSPAAILTQQVQHAPPSPRAFNPDLPAAVEEVLLRALAKEPAARYASAAEMIRALRAATPLETQTGNPQATIAVSPPPAVIPLPSTPGLPDPPPDPRETGAQPDHATIVAKLGSREWGDRE